MAARRARVLAASLLLAGCSSTFTNPRTGAVLATAINPSKPRPLPPVRVKGFTRTDQMTGGLNALAQGEVTSRGKALDEALARELLHRGVSVTSEDEADIHVMGYITPRLVVQQPAGMQVPFSKVAIAEFAVIVLLKSPRMAKPILLRKPVRMKETRLFGAFGDIDEPAARIAAAMIEEELVHQAGGTR